MKKMIFIANWKMNPSSLSEAKLLINELKKNEKKLKNVSLFIAPPFLYFFLFQRLKNIKLGAQNCFWEEKGAFTGEISPLMLKDFNCHFVILGHSERRAYLKEDCQMINKKIKIVLKNGLLPVVCLGEKRMDKNVKRRNNFLKREIFDLTKGIKQEEIKKIVFAYEPVFAIGTGVACPPDYAKETLSFLKSNFSNQFLYGGSVNVENFHLFLEVGFDGLLIGQVSLKIEEFLKILKKANAN